MKKSTAALALSAALMTGAAQAATVSFTARTARDFTIGRFDTGLGTLTGVAIDLFATGSGFHLERVAAIAIQD